MAIASLPRWFQTDASAWECGLFKLSAYGRGQDVVLVHGLAASPDTWEGAAGGLGPDVRLHIPHLRGFAGLPPATGRDPVNFLKPTADALATYIRSRIKRPVPLAGHSMGGIVALILARDHPDLIERLLVVDVPAFFSVLINPFATRVSMSAVAEHSRRVYLERSHQRLEGELRRASIQLVTHAQQCERIVRWGLTSDRATIADVMAEVMVTDLRSDLPSIGVPVDVIYGWDLITQRPRLALGQIYAAAYAGLPRVRMVRIDNARHYVMFDQPVGFYGAMTDWLTRRI